MSQRVDDTCGLENSASAARPGRGRLSSVLVACTAALLTVAAQPVLAGNGVKVFSDSAGDSISLFGIIDVGVLYQSNSTSTVGTNHGSIVRLAENGLRESEWGIKGSSGDLGIGGHTTAFFNLESHFDTTTGQLHGTGDVVSQATPLFRRQSNVGLSGDWGTIIAGRQYGPALLADVDTEPRAFKENFSNLYAWAYDTLATNNASILPQNINTNNDVGIFFENALQYRNTWGPVTIGVMHSFGGTNQGWKYNSADAVGVEYKGPVIFSGSYQQMIDQVTGQADVKQWSGGFAVPYKKFTFHTLFIRAIDNYAATGSAYARIDSLGAGVDWQWSKRNSATLAYYYNHDRLHGGDYTHDVVLSDDFHMTSWLTAYVDLAYVNQGPTATILTTIVADAYVQPGMNTTYAMTGLNFSF
ncbi:MAG: porin [Steroidobacteraceae bacterium]|nr:porin [Steroidobacteraceae bacterium]